MLSTSRQGKCHHVGVDFVQVPEASPQDADAIADVLVDARRWSYRDILPREALNMLQADEMSSSFARWLSEPHPGAAVFVAKRTGGIVGYAYVHPSEDVDLAEATELNSIYIMEHVAGTGVASALMDAAVEHARDRSDWSNDDPLSGRRALQENPATASNVLWPGSDAVQKNGGIFNAA
jgi:GNAT superfamily N-acetyltransferase